MRSVALALATSLGIGYIPFAPGTFGSAAGLLAWAILPRASVAQAAIVAVIFAVGSWSGSVAEAHFQRVDPSPVVIEDRKSVV